MDTKNIFFSSKSLTFKPLFLLNIFRLAEGSITRSQMDVQIVEQKLWESLEAAPPSGPPHSPQPLGSVDPRQILVWRMEETERQDLGRSLHS